MTAPILHVLPDSISRVADEVRAESELAGRSVEPAVEALRAAAVAVAGTSSASALAAVAGLLHAHGAAVSRCGAQTAEGMRSALAVLVEVDQRVEGALRAVG